MYKSTLTLMLKHHRILAALNKSIGIHINSIPNFTNTVIFDELADIDIEIVNLSNNIDKIINKLKSHIQ